MVIFDHNFFLLEMNYLWLGGEVFTKKEMDSLEECVQLGLLEPPDDNDNLNENRNNNEGNDNSKVHLDSASYSFCHMLINLKDFAKEPQKEREDMSSDEVKNEVLVEEGKEEEEVTKTVKKTKKVKSKAK